MKTYTLLIGLLFTSIYSFAQTIQQRLDKATQILLKDEQMKHAILGLLVVETNTGNIIYNLNEQIGLAPASTQKLFTCATAFDLLGKNYRFKTELGYDGKIENGVLKGNLYIKGSGDPTLGSWRYSQTKRDSILNKLFLFLDSAGIKKIDGNIILDISKFSYQPLPGGWGWDDIGNYYGAGTWALNWHENQYDLLLKPGKQEGDDVQITGIEPPVQNLNLTNFLKTGKRGSGDNGYIYLPPYTEKGFVEGTVPAGEKSFTISGSIPNPPYQFSKEIEQFLDSNKIKITGSFITGEASVNNYSKDSSSYNLLGTVVSPALDSICYWFLQRSVNLYGEALIKTIAYEKIGYGSTEKGVDLLTNFWSQRGIDKSAIHIMDGSGLSPQNRVTTDALVKVLRYAKTREWYYSFYNALPTYNGMKMKSGTIVGAKSFAGYHTAKNGIEYAFAIIVNNFDGSSGSIVQKMFKVLDELK